MKTSKNKPTGKVMRRPRRKQPTIKRRIKRAVRSARRHVAILAGR